MAPIPVAVENKLLKLKAIAFKSKGFGLGQPQAGKAVCRDASSVGYGAITLIILQEPVPTIGLSPEKVIGRVEKHIDRAVIIPSEILPVTLLEEKALLIRG